ncbi:DUF3626 domain-containing protein [Agrococcus sp. ARC_14]|uniref:DUF3626 domain-containing protein n=1 Tax=Agrococcus sp. ARC_14 TaxID=2919927 RepID=UPI001F053C0E|nr:DUF3626 domain-containing protein [Agrococcus sp. ARC_14]MCH1884379.1 DUF3626 domain-containing protein [Agrococcus sp. ARC_14]
MDAWRRAVEHVAARSAGGPLPPDARVTVHFHPDRCSGGATVLERIVAEGTYRSQFSTGISNGGLTAHPGGDRWRWESRMFGGAYDEAASHERPVYGAVEHRRRATGGAIRFGSCWLEVARTAWDRVTLCWPDSVYEPEHLGTPAHAGELLALADEAAVDPLDDYVEAQLHGGFEPARDAERLVLDPAFRGAAVERAAARLGVPIVWHPGLELRVDRIAELEAYRGVDALALALELAVDGRIDARILGEAAEAHDQQTIKRVWHLIARFGHRVAD